MVGEALYDVPVDGSISPDGLTVALRLIVKNHLVRIVLVPKSRLSVLLYSALAECGLITEDVFGSDRTEAVSRRKGGAATASGSFISHCAHVGVTDVKGHIQLVADLLVNLQGYVRPLVVRVDFHTVLVIVVDREEHLGHIGTSAH